MLFTVCMGETFAEEPDRVGIVQADSLIEATSKLTMWVETTDWGDYSRLGDPVIQNQTGSVMVRYKSQDPDGADGFDEYIISPLLGDAFMFLVEDWPYVFNRLPPHL